MQLWPTMTWALLAVAALLAAWAVLSDRPRGRLRCPGGWKRTLLFVPWRHGCWYDLAGHPERPDCATNSAAAPNRHAITCPECGRQWSRQRSLRRVRIRWRFVLLAAMIAITAYPAHVWPRVQKHGWWAGAPTWGLVLFAPVESYCRGALGCPFSWSQMPDATLELMTPTWDRPFAAWETAILKRRLEMGVERVRDEFPGFDAAFPAVYPYGNERWWGWAGRSFDREQRREFAQRVVVAPLGVTRDRLDVGRNPFVHSFERPMVAALPCGLFLVTGPSAEVADWQAGLDAVGFAGQDGRPIWSESESRAGSGRVAVAYEVGWLLGPPILAAPRDQPAAFGRRAIRQGDPVPSDTAFALELLMLHVEHEAWPSVLVADHPASMGVAGTTLLVRHTREGQQRVGDLLGAIRSVFLSEFEASRYVDTGEPGIVAAAYRVEDLPSAALTQAVNMEIEHSPFSYPFFLPSGARDGQAVLIRGVLILFAPPGTHECLRELLRDGDSTRNGPDGHDR